jgi:hypothetical protein
LAGAVLLLRAARGRLSVRLWAAGFIAVAVAALLGGTWHASASAHSDTGGVRLWKATLAAAGLGSFFLVAGAAFGSVSRRAAAWITSAAAAKFAVFLGWALSGDAFDPVVFDSALALAAILTLQLVAFVRHRVASAPWIVAGVVASLGAAALEALRPTLAPIGPDAGYHLVQLAGFFLFYRGGMLLR